AVPELLRQPFAVQPVLHEGPHHRRGPLGAERQAPSPPVLEGVHLFFHDVRGLTHAARKELGILKDGRANLAIPVDPHHIPHRRFDLLPKPGLARQDVAGASRRSRLHAAISPPAYSSPGAPPGSPVPPASPFSLRSASSICRSSSCWRRSASCWRMNSSTSRCWISSTLACSAWARSSKPMVRNSSASTWWSWRLVGDSSEALTYASLASSYAPRSWYAAPRTYQRKASATWTSAASA